LRLHGPDRFREVTAMPGALMERLFPSLARRHLDRTFGTYYTAAYLYGAEIEKLSRTDLELWGYFCNMASGILRATLMEDQNPNVSIRKFATRFGTQLSCQVFYWTVQYYVELFKLYGWKGFDKERDSIRFERVLDRWAQWFASQPKLDLMQPPVPPLRGAGFVSR